MGTINIWHFFLENTWLDETIIYISKLKHAILNQNKVFRSVKCEYLMPQKMVKAKYGYWLFDALASGDSMNHYRFLHQFKQISNNI